MPIIFLLSASSEIVKDTSDAMKFLLPLAALAIAAYFLLREQPKPPLPPPAAAAPAPTPVDFSIKVAVDKLYDHWRLGLSGRDDGRLPSVEVQAEFSKIKQVLSDRYKEHTERSLERNVAQAVSELRKKYRWKPTEEPHIAKGILGLRASPDQGARYGAPQEVQTSPAANDSAR
jgi:hypothetical protein